MGGELDWGYLPVQTTLPTVPPAIEPSLPDVAATEGTHALLPCRASGSPRPEVKWEKDGQPLMAAEDRVTVQPSGALLVKHSQVRPG